MMMVMLANADKYGDERVMEEFIKSLPSDDEDRLLCEAMMALDEKRYEESTDLIEKLTSLSPLAGKTMQAVMALEATKDTVIFHQIITEAIDGGYLMTNFLLAARYDVDGKREMAVEVMERIADKVPVANLQLGHYYCDDDKQKSLEYYRQADEWACLDSKGAAVLLEEMYRKEEQGEKQNEKEMNRLRLIRDGIGG